MFVSIDPAELELVLLRFQLEPAPELESLPLPVPPLLELWSLQPANSAAAAINTNSFFISAVPSSFPTAAK